MDREATEEYMLTEAWGIVVGFTPYVPMPMISEIINVKETEKRDWLLDTWSKKGWETHWVEFPVVPVKMKVKK